jgi:hypothetical protein
VVANPLKRRTPLVTLRHNGNDILLTPVEDGWRVQYRGREVESPYLEFAIANALGIEASDAIPLATRLLDDYLSSASTPPEPAAPASETDQTDERAASQRPRKRPSTTDEHGGRRQRSPRS